jgi:hypothetical protein
MPEIEDCIRLIGIRGKEAIPQLCAGMTIRSTIASTSLFVLGLQVTMLCIRKIIAVSQLAYFYKLYIHTEKNKVT